MSIKFKFMAVILTVLFAVAFVVGAQAQSTDTSTPEPSGSTATWGMGRMRGGFGSSPMFEAIAEALGLDAATLTSELQSGKTIAQVAEANHVELQTVYNAAMGVMEQHVSAMVTSGYLTQAQMDARLTWMRDNIAQMPMFSGQGVGGRMGGWMHDDQSGWSMGGHRGNWNGGMMGRGGMMGEGGRGQGCMMNCPWDD